MRIISWNILHGGGSRVDDIIAAIDSYAADVVCLQEFRHGKSKEPLCAGMHNLGYAHQHAPDTTARSRNSIALFSKFKMAADVLYRDKNDTARCSKAQITQADGNEFTIVNTSFPHKKEQIPLFDALLSLPGSYLSGTTLILGDFNCGIPFEDSQTKTFYATHMFQQMLQQGWIDSWRSRNPKAREFTWFSTQKGNGFRYDHALSSKLMDSAVSNITYDHSVREQKISDHSMMVIETA